MDQSVDGIAEQMAAARGRYRVCTKERKSLRLQMGGTRSESYRTHPDHCQRAAVLAPVKATSLRDGFSHP
ncbi:hypothetical protein ABVK50_32145 (plasmid) [Mesorhizobium sp. WSM2240]|uniref:Uncharacterized protein n=1 Tax=Mesorhizobium sp. WSM2240 TaxID=3228851 RepID=A0AAU8CYY0_9HYPH